MGTSANVSPARSPNACDAINNNIYKWGFRTVNARLFFYQKHFDDFGECQQNEIHIHGS